MKFLLTLLIFLTSFFSNGQEIQKKTQSFLINSSSQNGYVFSGGQTGQGIVNDSIKIGYLPLNFSFLNLVPIENNTTTIHPNPFNNKILINTENWNNIDLIQIYASNGSLVYEQKKSPENQNNNTINLDFLERGLYYISIFQNGKILTKKMVKS